MQTVRELLLGSGETAKQVARRTGYKSDAAFNRAFTRHHGRSPGQWRQNRDQHIWRKGMARSCDARTGGPP